MSDVIDWSKAPEGYPIWIQGANGGFVSGWYRELWDRYESPRGTYYMKRDARYFTAHTRPKPTPWSGEGLPPVGTVCEVEGETIVVIAHHCNGTQAIYAESITEGLLYYGNPGAFRPIRTQEQIAEHEKTLAVERMSLIVGDIDTVPTWTDALSTLYDAGLRFTK